MGVWVIARSIGGEGIGDLIVLDMAVVTE